jgi:ribosomal-protein-serine acetyltransferase
MPWAEVKPSVDESEEYVREAAANWILKKDAEPYLPLLMFDKTNQHFVGGTGFHHIDWDVPCLEIGYWIRDSYTGQGYMSEAVNALTRYAIDELKMRRIEIRCDILNLQSKKVAERLGYHLEATLKSNRVDYITSVPSDTLIYVRHDLAALPDLNVTWDDLT